MTEPSVLEQWDEFQIAPMSARTHLAASAMTCEAFQREPVTVTLCVPLPPLRKWIDGLTQRCVPDGISTVCLDKSGKVVASCLCVDAADPHSVGDECPPEIFGDLDEMLHSTFLRYLAAQGHGSDPTQLARGVVIHILMFAADASVQGKGLVQKLCKWSLELARQKGYREAYLEATNARSQSTSSRLGFVPVHTLVYKDYENAKGQRPLENIGSDNPTLVVFTYPLNRKEAKDSV